MRSIGSTAFALWTLGSAAALAADAYPASAPELKPALKPVTPGVTITLGVDVRSVPRWTGADNSTIVPLPLFDISAIGAPPRFHAARDGFGFGLISEEWLRVGPTVKVRLPRKESDDSVLRGLGNVDWAIEAGAFVDLWWQPWLRTRAELRQGFGGHDGLVADLTADAVIPILSQLRLSGGPRVTLATARAVAPYFGVTPQQSAATGLPAYDPKGGVYSFGAGAQLRYFYDRRWSVYVFTEFEHLAGEAARSPLVTQRGSLHQWTYGAGATYSFDWAW